MIAIRLSFCLNTRKIIKVNGLTVMNKKIMIGLMCSAAMFSGCDYFKHKKEQSADEVKVQKVQDFSCTAKDNVEQIQSYLKEEYLKDLDRRLRNSEYESDQNLLDKIRKNIKFEISHISTKTDDPKQSNTLQCSSLITAISPNGLQKRAENAFLDAPCAECDGDMEDVSTLQDYFDQAFSGLTLKNDRLNGVDFIFHIDKSDSNEISLTIENHSVISQSAYITELAVQYASYIKANEKNKEDSKKYDQQNAEQMNLAQKALDVRQKELDGDQKAAVEKLNAAWERLSPEQQESLQQDQSDWFEKRDVDCKVLSQKSVHSIDEKDLETYQKKSDYWDDKMSAQNQAIQYSKCFIQKSKERAVYLNNAFN